MPGLYLAAIIVSAAGVALLDRRFRLAAWDSPGRTAAAVGIGTAFFLLWDAVGIATGVFVKGDSVLLLGIDLAPELPLEEPFFLAFLCYLALVLWAGARRALSRRAGTDAASPRTSAREGA
ncbi:lycopene cyclase domain-containing protein [Microbacterium sp. CFBP9034]|uniref:lycopene cyclase domain-containing protein n=1 Tax=Microbacterium sp. CFBP9034 TaxID=3096540 RepID=UPI002A6AD23D|nr:lycopene cyclase domain-containing protein [Microbacterium sp. CFBP9034]MDY0909323.1 lycopene cyclase domain-containing protein [Microbacterium sp. CFBP9034]